MNQINDIANDIALIVCKQCPKLNSETEIEYSSRLYNVYKSCYKNICSINNAEISAANAEAYEKIKDLI